MNYHDTEICRGIVKQAIKEEGSGTGCAFVLLTTFLMIMVWWVGTLVRRVEVLEQQVKPVPTETR